MVDKAEIRNTLKKYFDINAKITIADDGRVSVAGSVVLLDKHSHLPVQFDKVNGGFYCSHSELQSLQGSPTRVRRYFSCLNNNLLSLEGGPDWVGGSFNCENNPLESLKGFPSHVGGIFHCTYNPSLPLLRMLVAKRGVVFQDSGEYPYATKIQDVLNQFKGQGKAGVLQCSHALLSLEKELQKEDSTVSLRANIKW